MCACVSAIALCVAIWLRHLCTKQIPRRGPCYMHLMRKCPWPSQHLCRCIWGRGGSTGRVGRQQSPGAQCMAGDGRGGASSTRSPPSDDAQDAKDQYQRKGTSARSLKDACRALVQGALSTLQDVKCCWCAGHCGGALWWGETKLHEAGHMLPRDTACWQGKGAGWALGVGLVLVFTPTAP